MNTAMKATLLAIVVVIGGMTASFIWFVATWDKDVKEPMVLNLETQEETA